jgi:hypothetical protein
MKKKELVTELIKRYETAILYAKESKCNKGRFLIYLKGKYINSGLCSAVACMSHTTRRTLPSKWISKYVPKGYLFIGLPPKYLETKAEMVQSLQTRLGVLEKELKKCR